MTDKKFEVKRIEAEARKKFSSRIKQRVRDLQTNVCAGDGCTYEFYNTQGRLREYHIDHIKPLWGGGTNEIDNLQALCPKCHSKKTALEATSRAKADRMRRFYEEGKGRKRKGAKMQSRGFDTRLRKKMNGEVEWKKGKNR